MKTSLSLNGTAPSRSAVYSKEEFKVIYGIQALLSKRIVTKNNKGRYHFRPGCSSKAIMQVMRTGLTKFPGLQAQVHMALEFYRPSLLGGLQRFLVEEVERKLDTAKALGLL